MLVEHAQQQTHQLCHQMIVSWFLDILTHGMHQQVNVEFALHLLFNQILQIILQTIQIIKQQPIQDIFLDYQQSYLDISCSDENDFLHLYREKLLLI